MTKKELIEELQNYDDDLEIIDMKTGVDLVAIEKYPTKTVDVATGNEYIKQYIHFLFQ